MIIICRSLFSDSFGGQKYEIEVLAGPHGLQRLCGKTNALPLPASEPPGVLSLLGASVRFLLPPGLPVEFPSLSLF